ncbi:MAG: helix-turn-helix domain-containing protein [Lachnospiraceae bacterium]|nr:helix-turn-helix domain-containing protein [Ruminococcus sp.]MCM1276725.1 helix-turn-helix domain-containing protein [Lachnospiraceae bacterium]
MTIGEKIKYLRKQKGVTQTELAELTGIHQVSIAKYEKDKMIPQPEQLEKITEALNVSRMIFVDDGSFKLETRGDLMGLLITLCKSGVLVVSGKRNRNSMLIPLTVTFEFNPLISKFFAANTQSKIQFNHDEPLLLDFLKWERQYHNYKKLFKKYSGSSSKADVAAFEELRDIIEKIEIELQCSPIPL